MVRFVSVIYSSCDDHYLNLKILVMLDFIQEDITSTIAMMKP